MSGKGQELMEQAEQRLQRWSIFGCALGGSRYEEAAELFDKAGNQFKVAQEFKAAAAAYMRASDCLRRGRDPYASATKLVDAARCFKKVRSPDAATCLDSAVDMLTEEGRFANAAKLQKELADFYKQEGAHDQAVQAYMKAADFFAGEEQHTSANGALLEVAQLYAEQLHRHAEAAGVLEKVAASYVQHQSMKFQVKDMLLRAMLCRLAQLKPSNVGEGAAVCREALQRYLDLDLHLQGTREHELMEGVLAAIEAEEPEAVSKAASDYNGVKKLDDWQVQVLADLKAVLQDDSGALC
eukprot:TRINITY_DN21306_c0_g1_i1.p1 TRINITY_DN21306_c0_g1~~TRINITY_DN21306_c0_g1_i1.p1  ORF type:complete len:321 (+),score=103.74 TRINITY_DN21306_c0_g1_i1:73-963(+)